MGILQVELFGGVRVTHDNWLTEVKLTREIQVLLAYLLLHRQKVHSREVIAGIFWSEHSQEKARGSLNTALWKLRKALEPEGVLPGTYLRNTHNGEVGFNKESEYWLDVDIFEKELNRILIRPTHLMEEANIADLDKALALYSGELLEGFYRDWALRERERLRSLYLKSLSYLMQYYASHAACEKAIAYGQQVLDLDPLREEIHREIMKLYLRNGQRALAVRQYEICRAILANELGILPMEDTQLLYTQIYPGNTPKYEAPGFQGQAGVHQAIGQLSEAGKAIDLAREQIQQALQLIQKFSGNSDQL